MKKFILGSVLLLSAHVSWTQSYHFSQFFSTPLLTNPANTGFTEGAFRVASNIRSQGGSGNNFFTGYLSADVSPLRSKLTPGHKAGVGLYVMNDHSLSSALQTNSVGISTAYHVGLDPYGEHSIGIGVQGTFNQRRIDYSKLSFESQFGPGGYDPSLAIGEALDVNSKDFFDLNIGAIYNAVVEDKILFAGFSVYNLLKHDEGLLGNEFKMPTRYTLQAGAQLYAGPTGKVYISLTSVGQAKAYETTVGGAYGLQLTGAEKTELIGGLWYRYKDAMIPYLGLQRSGFQIGLSYDYTVSSLKTSSQVRNGYELTLIYKSPDKRELKTTIPWY